MGTIRFTVEPFEVNTRVLVLLPKSASIKLPSRGMVMINGTLNGFEFQAPLEPDGRGSHWFEVDKTLRDNAGAHIGETATIIAEPTKQWPEPKVPADVQKALNADPQANTLWNDVTPMARWDWLRWISSTSRSETRKKRIGVAFSKLKAGTRRPCCFNRALCTDPTVSKGGVLLEPTPAKA